MTKTMRKKRWVLTWTTLILTSILLAGCGYPRVCYEEVVNGLTYFSNGCYGEPGYPAYRDNGGFPEEGVGPGG